MARKTKWYYLGLFTAVTFTTIITLLKLGMYRFSFLFKTPLLIAVLYYTYMNFTKDTLDPKLSELVCIFVVGTLLDIKKSIYGIYVTIGAAVQYVSNNNMEVTTKND